MFLVFRSSAIRVNALELPIPLGMSSTILAHVFALALPYILSVYKAVLTIILRTTVTAIVFSLAEGVHG